MIPRVSRSCQIAPETDVQQSIECRQGALSGSPGSWRGICLRARPEPELRPAVLGPHGPLPAAWDSPAPWIFSEQQILALLEQTGQLEPVPTGASWRVRRFRNCLNGAGSGIGKVWFSTVLLHSLNILDQACAAGVMF